LCIFSIKITFELIDCGNTIQLFDAFTKKSK